MAARPTAFANLMIAFSEKPWFHPFEIFTRIIIGAGLWYFASDTPYTRFFEALGILVFVVGVGLLLIGAEKHRAFAHFAADRFQAYFRLAGLCFAPIGVWGLWLLL